jgi:hypothetical protein
MLTRLRRGFLTRVHRVEFCLLARLLALDSADDTGATPACGAEQAQFILPVRNLDVGGSCRSDREYILDPRELQRDTSSVLDQAGNGCAMVLRAPPQRDIREATLVQKPGD